MSAPDLPEIIDIHTHFMPQRVLDKVWAYFDSAGPLTGRPWPITYRTDEGERLATLRALGVRAFPSLNYAHRPGMAQWLNDWSSEFAAKHDDVLHSATFYPEPGAADYTAAAIEAGARMATHLHNACRPAHHREPGPAVALLEDPRVGIETIVDGVHLHPATVRRVAREAGERWILVSDAMAAAGCGDGEFPLGPLRVRVHDGVARVVGADGAAGAIAGSTATVAGSVRSAVAAGVDLDAALRAATAAPADALGLPDVGRLRAGSRADAVVFGPELEVRGVLRHGTWVKAAAPAVAD